MHAISAAVGIPICTSIETIKAVTSQDTDLQMLKTVHIIQGWPHTKGEVGHSIQKYWPIRHKQVMIDDIPMKGK